MAANSQNPDLLEFCTGPFQFSREHETTGNFSNVNYMRETVIAYLNYYSLLKRKWRRQKTCLCATMDETIFTFLRKTVELIKFKLFSLLYRSLRRLWVTRNYHQ